MTKKLILSALVITLVITAGCDRQPSQIPAPHSTPPLSPAVSTPKPDSTPPLSSAAPTSKPTLSPSPRPTTTSQNDVSRFFVGGVIDYYLGEKVWDNRWQQLNPLKTLHENGFDWVSIHLTTNNSPVLSRTPVKDWGSLPWDYSYLSSLQYVEETMKEASDIGLRLNLVFFLSNAEAKASLQNTPPEWKNLTLDELVKAVHDYTFNTTKYFKDRGLNIEIYDIGNEIDGGILNYRLGEKVSLPVGVTDAGKVIQDMDYMKINVWNTEARLLKSAIAGVKEADHDAKITLHAAKLSFPLFVTTFFETMIEQGVEFDFAGLSFPPAGPDWFVRYQNDPVSWMQPIIDSIKSMRKKVIISEFLYPSDPKGVTSFEGVPANAPEWVTRVPVPGYPFTLEGQAKAVRDMMSFWRKNDSVMGAFYFFPDTFREVSQGKIVTNRSGDFYGLFETDSQTRPAISQFGPSPPSFPTVDLIDDTAAPFLWSGNWEIYKDAKYSGGTCMASAKSGAQVSITFKGTGVAVIYTVGKKQGVAKVEIDGVYYADIDMYSPQSVFRITNVVATDLPPSKHVLTITVSGDKNPASGDTFILVDAVDVMRYSQ